MMKKTQGVIAALLLGLFVTAAQAVPMSNLFDGGELTVGDKRFHNWQLNSATLNIFDLWDLDYSQIEVTGDASDPMDIGLNFDGGGQLALSGGDFGNFGDLSFSFDVSVIGGMNQIVGVGLGITDIETTGLGFAGIAEGVDVPAIPFPTLAVDSDFNLSDSAAIAGTDSVSIEKNILLGTFGPDDSVALNSFEQRFIQAPVAVPAPVPAPAPAPLALLALGLVGLGLRRRG